MAKIQFANASSWYRKYTIDKRILRTVLQQIATDHGFHVEHISIVLTTDEELLEVNRRYLKHDYYTDVITFDLGNKAQYIHGEAYISKDRIESNATKFNCSPCAEFSRVAIHACLHLCGHKDKTQSDQTIMRTHENKYLNLYIQKLSVPKP